tara:strand:- start:1361 stop:2599 length:1239 start_codon:yes stop_codon:yes gene_type:complete
MSWIKNFLGKNREEILISSFILILLAFVISIIFILLLLRLTGEGAYVSISYYIYLFSLSFLVLIFIRRRIYNYFFLITLILELLFGLMPIALDKLGITDMQWFVPRAQFETKFEFHPMLGAIPLSEYSSEEANHSKKSVRKNKNKFDQSKDHIAIFGGSTTYDIGIYDEDTWVSIIDELLPSYSVSNNGVPGYSSAEHVIQTAFYPDRAGKMPICNVYLMGWNDIRSFGIKDLDSGYANFHLLSQYGNLKIRRSLNTPSPILNVLLMNFGANELPLPMEEGELNKDITSTDMMFTFAARNIENIVAINKERNINSLFIAQILNKSMLEKNDDIFGWVPYVKNSNLWPLQKRFNNMVNKISKEKEFFYYSPNEDFFTDQDFLDHGHFSKEGAVKFANLVLPKIKQSCNLKYLD